MEAAKDLFEEVEIEVPEGMDLPTAIQASAEEDASDDGAASEPDSESSAGDASEDENAAESAKTEKETKE
jgi:hypothetical protein